MKKIPQNVLVLIGCIVVAVVIFAVYGSYSSAAPLQRQIIHVQGDPGMMLSNSGGLIKISDIKPNSAVRFWYPDPDRYKNRDPYELFTLVRLPDYLGGTVNDASAFRAYSVIDPSSHCLVKYWPQEGRRIIQDSCSGNIYEPVFGHATLLGQGSILVSKNLALPYLDITTDSEGHLYAEPPVWAEDKNGIVGIGRTVSDSEIKSTNEFIAAREKQIKDAIEDFEPPSTLSSGYVLKSVRSDGIRSSIAEYYLANPTLSPVSLYYEYCNCTKSAGLLADEELTYTESQLMDLDGVPIVVYPKSINYLTKVHDDYVFVFYDKGYKLTLHTDQELQPGLKLVRELLASVDSDNVSKSSAQTTNQREITILSTSPQNVTLPEPKNQTYKTTCSPNGVCFTPE